MQIGAYYDIFPVVADVVVVVVVVVTAAAVIVVVVVVVVVAGAAVDVLNGGTADMGHYCYLQFILKTATATTTRAAATSFHPFSAIQRIIRKLSTKQN